MEVAEVVPESHDSQAQLSETNDGDDKDDSNRKDKKQKRTKTGCLTCRKRRIKCDEARPTCNKCFKSKRDCEGYIQRVVFKDTRGTFHGSNFAPIGFAPEHAHHSHLANPLSSAQGRRIPPASASSQAPLPTIAPKPSALDDQSAPQLQYNQAYQGQAESLDPSSFNFNQSFVAPPLPATTSVLIPSTLSPIKRDAGASLSGYHHHSGHASVSSGFQVPSTLAAPTAPGLNNATRAIMSSYDLDMDADDLADDTSMGDSNDEMIPYHQSRVDWGAVVASHSDGPLDPYGTRMREFAAFAYDNILTSYTPSPQDSPLTNSTTAAVFWHFVNVTGPSMSLYERHPFDHSKVVQEQANANAAQNIWTYTFPILSLKHPALLQAMLALGSLQIAHLQRTSATAAMKHYHLAIRRLAKNVQSPTRRAQPATLAASLLLAYYEVWSSDHSKWCNHLYGARILFSQINFRDMTRTVLPVKRMRTRRLERERQEPFNPFFSGSDNLVPRDLDELDMEVLNVIAGRALDPMACGQGPISPALVERMNMQVTDRDVENYEHLRDLFWWNCKMDVYQSFLGGTKLFMNFEEWDQCPPRAPIGRLDAIYGTFDHLLFLLGRLANFVSRDLPRKRKAFKLRNAGGISPSMFEGMLPTKGKITAPMGFSPPRDASPQSDHTDDIDLDASTALALKEWESLKEAFEFIRERFGTEFEPLGAEYTDRRESPFGLTLQYRTFSVAGIWMNYYMGLIHLQRAHPSMPPATMIAAGMAARDTRPFAIEIGRIAAGLAGNTSHVTEISTMVGAAFIESCFCLFVAGIQYQDDGQRHWLIRRMHDISRLTGWRSAMQIADGCEASWIKAAQLGRGPPYARHPDLVKKDPETVWSNPRRIDRKIQELDDESPLIIVRADRAFYALGLLSVAEDLERLELDD